jgi:hypothetical protein
MAEGQFAQYRASEMMMPAPMIYGQPREEKTNMTPVYMLLGLVSILGIVAVVLTASNHGALVDMKAPASMHDHDLEAKIDTVKETMGKKTDLQGLATKDKLNDLYTKVSTDNAGFYAATVQMQSELAVIKAAVTNKVMEVFASKKPPAGNTNVCAGKKPKTGFDNVECVEATVDEQAAADVSSPFQGTKATDKQPISTSYWKAGMCPVNVHWHLGAEHRSAGQYDESGTGSQKKSRRAADPRQGLRCHHYNDKDAMFNTPYEFKHCKNMHVGETYEVHWPHSAGGACGTVNQYQTPFYDGVFCNAGDLANTGTGFNIGVQAQVFTIVNDEAYYYPDLMKGMIIDGDKGDDMVFYTGSTTGDSRSNSVCSKYTPITWQVDRKCHLVSASAFDKMCADMKAQRDDMTDDLHPHGAREVVSAALTANNMKAGSLSGGRASFP